jgi:pyridoxamine 5'-phosphate oxidase
LILLLFSIQDFPNFVIQFSKMSSIAEIRKEYRLRTLSEEEVQENPIEQFNAWWKEAIASQIEEVNAMTLATASSDGVPAARIVLLKGFDDRGFVFFTNYKSYKGRQLQENPRACLVFFWKELERQVRITGLVEKVSPAESDEYFSGRPEGSKIGAWASPQSQVILDRSWLLESENKMREKFEETKLTRPGYWGGYRVKPITVEFWQGRQNRLHDRIQFSLEESGKWKIERLAP